MKSLEEIKNEVANTHGHKYWFIPHNKEIANDWIAEVAKRYAAEVLEEAAKKVTMTVERDNSIISTGQLAFIADDGDFIIPNKTSILKIKEELK